ncbi:hypothetical protein CEXT_306391 [Caerostris extrusa]|uniref:Uncharacterized protein n=1 Tax=Caerostris extrusa TaxID=172846 RepID=A0AAV4MNG0_CAEEX|nr:hypothetical protein CEXT_306391 [Caerostris extrusa]
MGAHTPKDIARDPVKLNQYHDENEIRSGRLRDVWEKNYAGEFKCPYDTRRKEFNCTDKYRYPHNCILSCTTPSVCDVWLENQPVEMVCYPRHAHTHHRQQHSHDQDDQHRHRHSHDQDDQHRHRHSHDQDDQHRHRHSHDQDDQHRQQNVYQPKHREPPRTDENEHEHTHCYEYELPKSDAIFVKHKETLEGLDKSIECAINDNELEEEIEGSLEYTESIVLCKSRVNRYLGNLNKLQELSSLNMSSVTTESERKPDQNTYDNCRKELKEYQTRVVLERDISKRELEKVQNENDVLLGKHIVKNPTHEK